jgi:hypothetical protein
VHAPWRQDHRRNDDTPRARRAARAAQVEAQALRCQGMRQPTLTGRLMGDPLPGRSALDRLSNS